MSLARKPVIGLTGGIGSGKSAAAERFVALGASLVDTDQIAHQLCAPGGAAIPALLAAFGTEFVTLDGALDRARMRAHVFAAPAERARLEGILHPMIRSQAAAAIAAAAGPYIILAVPLLVEHPYWQTRCDRIAVVDCSEEVQLARVMARNALDEGSVRAIMAAQASRAARYAIAQDIIDNNGNFDSLRAQVDRLHVKYVAADSWPTLACRA